VALHPEVTLLADAYDEDWTRLWWVRVRGRARVVPEGDDAAGDGLALLAEKYQQYRVEPPPGPVIEVQVYEWRGWSAASAL
jgi:PPOX class probable F420-dependent enzyme